MTSRTYEEILLEMKNYMIANQSKITDFNTGSVILTMFEAMARPIERAYIDTRKGFENNLRAIPYAVFDFDKKSGAKASVDLVFSRSSAGTSSVSIPSGTIVSNGSYNFVTTAAGTIAAGDTDSGTVSASAEYVGSAYNLTANTITTIESVVSAEIVSVTNPNKATGGSDEESDTELLARFKKYINGLQGSNNYGIEAGVLSIDGVRSVSLLEHFPPKDDIYNMTVYVDDGTGALTDTLKESVETIINGDGTSTYPGLKAAGVNIDVMGATQVKIAIVVTCTISQTEEAYARAEILSTLQEKINSLEINENVVLTDLILRLRGISYVTDVSHLTVNGSTENIAISESQIARFDSLTLTIESE